MNSTAAEASLESGRLETPDQVPDISLSADHLKAAFRQHPGGVAVVTADDGTGPVGMTVTSVFSVSAEPPLLVFSTSQLSSSTPTILRAETAIVHLLDADTLHLAKLCATSGVDRFADESLWQRLSTGEPLFTEAKVWIRGKIINRFDAGGSTLIVLHAMESSVATNEELPEGAPLVYHNRTWHHIGPHSTIDE